MATLTDLIQRVRLVLTDANKFKGQINDIGKSFDRLGKRMRATGRRMSLAISAPIVGAFGLAIKSAVDFESAMADVKKVVEFPTPEVFKEMGEDLRKLALRIPIAVEGLADIMAEAGKAGIARDKLLEFTELVSTISVAFELTAKETGNALSTIQTSLGLTIPEVSLLADQMNVLAKNMATTEADILQIVNRVGALGKIAGVSAKDIATIGAAMVASGVDADRASTSVRNILINMTSGAAATDTQKAAFEALGTTSVEMAKRIQNEGAGVIIEVFEKINQKAPEVRLAILNALFDRRVVESAGPLLGNMDLLRKAFGLVANDADVLGSTVEEYGIRSETTANKLILLKSTLNELAIVIGTELLPLVLSLTETLTGFLESASETEKSIIRWGIALAGLAAILGPIIFTIGLFASGVGKIITGIVWLTPYLITFGSYLTTIATGTGIVVSSFALLVAGVFILGAALGGLIYYLTQTEEGTKLLNEVWSKLASELEVIGGQLLSVWERTFTFISNEYDLFKQDVQMVVDAITSAWDGFANWFANTWLGKVVGVIKSAISWFMQLIGAKDKAAGSAAGGPVVSRAGGGRVWGAGTSTSDSIWAKLSRGEYVIKAAAVSHYGQRLFDMLNSMMLPKMASGGMVQATPQQQGGNLHPLILTIGSETIEGLLAPEHTANQLIRFSINKQIKSTGRKPGWYR